MGMFDNYPQPDDYIPDNRPRPMHKHDITIMTGEDASHTFDVPFDVNEDCNAVEVIYKLGLDIALIKETADLEIISKQKGNWHISSVTAHLSSDETQIFNATLLSTRVQLKFIMNDGSVQFSEIYPVNVMDSLNSSTKPIPATDGGFGWTED